jgi:hypothetical protein
MRTAPRPIRQSRSSLRELARNRLVRPTLLPIRLGPETHIVGDRSQTLSSQTLGRCAILDKLSRVAGILRGFVDCTRLRPRTSPASRYCFCSAVLLSFDTLLLCGRCFATVVCVWKPLRSCDSSACLHEASTRDETQLMITPDYDMAA